MSHLRIFIFLMLLNVYLFSYPVQEGVASYYAEKFHGKRTASGEIFDMYKMTAAHKTLPLGTLVEVTNLDNKKKVVVKVNDRGPFKKSRILDVSLAAAKKLDMIKKGTARVSIKPLSSDWIISSIDKEEGKQKEDVVLADSLRREKDSTLAKSEETEAKVFTIQLAAFSNPASAFEFYQSTQSLLKNVYINGPIGNSKLYKIQTGSFFGYEDAKSYHAIVQKLGYNGSFITSFTGS